MHRAQLALIFALIACVAALAGGQIDPRYDGLVISELFFDPPGPDNANWTEYPPGSGMFVPRSWEYIELRGTPGMSLAGHYLIFTESEDTGSPSNPPGNIDHVFDLSDKVIGTNGYTLILPLNPGRSDIAPGTQVYQQTNPMGYGFGSGASSDVGSTDQNGDGTIENGAFSCFLIRNDTGVLPAVNQKLDINGDAILDPAAVTGWTFLDAIGQLQPGEEDGWGYADVSFTKDPATNPAHFGPNTVNVYTSYEPEHLFRAGASAGAAPDDWFMANVTDNPASGYDVVDDHPDHGFVNSGDHAAPLDSGELIRGPIPDGADHQPGILTDVPEGAILQDNLGRPNFPIPDGDLNQDGYVTQADLDIVLNNFGQTDLSLLGYWLFGDPSGDGTVGQADLDIVNANLGKGPGTFTFAGGNPVWMEFTDPAVTTLDGPPAQQIPGDCDGDGDVDLTDLAILASNYGSVAPPPLGPTKGNFDGDNDVDLTDLALLANNYGTSPRTALPEPASATMLALAGLATLRRRNYQSNHGRQGLLFDVGGS